MTPVMRAFTPCAATDPGQIRRCRTLGAGNRSTGWRLFLLALVIAVGLAPQLGCAVTIDSTVGEATITAADLARRTQELSGDEFAGRGPAGRGEPVTLEYLEAEYRRLGLDPVGDDGTYLQRVPVNGITLDPETVRMEVPSSTPAARRGELEPLSFGEDYVVWSLHEEAAIDVTAPLVFVGYGVDASNESWNDFKTDVRGAIVVILVNDPPVAGKFGDAAMTYYGRWTYKYEEAARQGAAGALIIHETEAAGYGWQVVRSSWTGEQFSLPSPTDQPAPTRFEGWISQRTAAELFSSAGMNLADMVASASSPDFAPVPLGFAATVHLDNQIRRINSHNVVGKLGSASESEVDDEYVVYSAHWDHLGEDTDLADAGEDGIYNGAFDNASGVAALLELAEAFGALEARTRRSHLFIATTLEEQGLLGAQYYTSHPLVPLEKTLAVINIDGINVWGRTEDVTVVGLGNSTLDDILLAAIEPDGRSLTPDPEPEKGFFYRSDHFPFAKVGVPALYADAGVHFIGQPENYSELVREQYNLLNYHQPSDEFDPTWDFSGAEQDIRALFQVGFAIAQTDVWPTWRPGNEFKAARESSLEPSEH